ncbi:hypothetical protein VR46_19355, partial [Streptomyces sp. NRRL S-444]
MAEGHTGDTGERHMAARRLPALAQYRTDAVTRRLCAGAHLDEDFARDVDVELTADGLRATGLS